MELVGVPSMKPEGKAGSRSSNDLCTFQLLHLETPFITKAIRFGFLPPMTKDSLLKQEVTR